MSAHDFPDGYDTAFPGRARLELKSQWRWLAAIGGLVIALLGIPMGLVALFESLAVMQVFGGLLLAGGLFGLYLGVRGFRWGVLLGPDIVVLRGETRTRRYRRDQVLAFDAVVDQHWGFVRRWVLQVETERKKRKCQCLVGFSKASGRNKRLDGQVAVLNEWLRSPPPAQ